LVVNFIQASCTYSNSYRKSPESIIKQKGTTCLWFGICIKLKTGNKLPQTVCTSAGNKLCWTTHTSLQDTMSIKNNLSFSSHNVEETSHSKMDTWLPILFYILNISVQLQEVFHLSVQQHSVWPTSGSHDCKTLHIT
jgi:hypothetical protein